MVEESATSADPAAATPAVEKSDNEAKIIQQVEYYFGDVNLPRDKFLREQIKADDGWISLETMIKFKRLAQLTTDFGEIVAALKKSDSGLLEVDADNNKIRRSPHVPLPEMNEERRKELAARSAYVRRFPLDHKIDQLLEFFSKAAPGYESIIMRHYHDKAEKKWNFKGSVFILFKTVDACKQFLEGDELEYNGEKLVKMWQNDYVAEKRQERLDERRKNKKGAKNGSDGKKEEGGGQGKKSDEEDETDAEFPLGAVVNLTGFKDNSKTKREEIKAKIEGYGIPVAFIDFNLGEQAAWVRMEQKDAAKELAKKVAEEGETMKVNDDELTVRILEGEEEEQYLVKAKEIKQKRRNNFHEKRGGRKGRRGGGRGGSRGGGRGRWKRSGSPVSRNDQKKQKTE